MKIKQNKKKAIHETKVEQLPTLSRENKVQRVGNTWKIATIFQTNKMLSKFKHTHPRPNGTRI